MSGLQYRNGSYRLHFRYHGKLHAFTIGQVSTQEAETKAAHVDYLLMRLKQRLAALPPGMGISEYVQFDGQQRPAQISPPHAPPPQAPPPQAPPPEIPVPPTAKLSLAQLRDRYLATHEASLEANTVATIRLYFRHLAGQLGESFPIAELSLVELQQYVDHRARARGAHGRKVSAITIQKEIVSLGTAWNWGTKMKLVNGRFPYDDLPYPKTVEMPRFQTLGEIERQTKTGGLTAAEQAELYECLYLQLRETTDLLAYVQQKAVHGFIYPMFCLAAHTGARHSELIRMKVADVDLVEKYVTIRELKRDKSRATTRRVPMSGFLIGVIAQWLDNHPGGPWLFCHELTVSRSRKRSLTTGHLGQKLRPTSGQQRKDGVRPRRPGATAPLTKDEAHDHFKRTLAGSRWSVLRGWHVLRHSFISACASRGVDQRLVESWAGHMSPEMSRRYSHLYPSTQQAALSGVFDAVA